uniref:Uncharacterized protein n=1 Tax=Tetranychus urticae TaxID=32264 RepID=T1L3J1_TETUR
MLSPQYTAVWALSITEFVIVICRTKSKHNSEFSTLQSIWAFTLNRWCTHQDFTPPRRVHLDESTKGTQLSPTLPILQLAWCRSEEKRPGASQLMTRATLSTICASLRPRYSVGRFGTLSLMVRRIEESQPGQRLEEPQGAVVSRSQAIAFTPRHAGTLAKNSAKQDPNLAVDLLFLKVTSDSLTVLNVPQIIVVEFYEHFKISEYLLRKRLGRLA